MTRVWRVVHGGGGQFELQVVFNTGLSNQSNLGSRLPVLSIVILGHIPYYWTCTDFIAGQMKNKWQRHVVHVVLVAKIILAMWYLVMLHANWSDERNDGNMLARWWGGGCGVKTIYLFTLWRSCNREHTWIWLNSAPGTWDQYPVTYDIQPTSFTAADQFPREQHIYFRSVVEIDMWMM